MSNIGKILLTGAGLLVVAGILLPILEPHVRDNARRASCMSNMKQLGLALSEYEQDNSGSLPSTELSTSNGIITWRDRTFPYVKSAAAYRCPDDIRDPNSSSTTLPASYSASQLGVDAKGYERGAFAVREGLPSLRPTSIPKPGQLILLVDMRGYTGGEWNIIAPTFLPQTGRELYAHIPRHMFYEHSHGPVNFLFADGHVKGINPLATLTPINLWTHDNAPFSGQDLQNAQAILKHAEQE
jgi:prepilin-type processing-associated H-X9-DG protein